MLSFPATSTAPVSRPSGVSTTRAVAAFLTLKPRFVASFVLSRTRLSALQGVRQIKNTDLNPVYCFIAPPTLSALRARLRGRGTETEASVQKRLSAALKEVEFAKEPGVHDVVIVNDDLDRAYELFKKVALGESIEGDRLPPLDD